MKQLLLSLSLVVALFNALVHAEIKTLTVEMNVITDDGIGEKVGTVTFEESVYGLIIRPNMRNIEPGVHGFHIHDHPDCGNVSADGTKGAGLSAGGHFDPKHTKRHLGPWDDEGHLGDLPVLYVTGDGTATTAILAPKIKTLKIIQNRSVMVHVHGDNFDDHPMPMGGGGARMVCGVIQ